jgi:mono/diheme cytochrome c family protein
MKAFRACLAISGVIVVAGCRSGGSHEAAAPAPAQAAPAAAASANLPVGVTADMVTAGEQVFNGRSCKNCHGMNGVGGPNGPNLTDQNWVHISGSYDEIVKLVTNGFTKAEQRETQYRFTMNPRGGVQLSDAQIRNVAAYVWSLSHK